MEKKSNFPPEAYSYDAHLIESAALLLVQRVDLAQNAVIEVYS